MRLKIRVSDMIHIRKDENPDLDVQKIYNRFRFANPAYLKQLRLGLNVFGVPKDLVLASDRFDEVVIPRGLLRPLFETWAVDGILDETVTIPVEIPEARIETRDYQQAALDALLLFYQGLYVCPTGGGKTAVGVALISKRGQKALVLVHTKDLLNQWAESFKRFCGIEVGVIQGDTFNIKDVTIAMMQSLNKPLSKEFVNQFGLVLVDECQHVPTNTMQSILDQLPARYRYGVTATPYRADELDFMIHALLGQTIHEVHAEDLFRAKAIIRPSIRVIRTESYCSECLNYNDLLAHIVSDEARNELILDAIFREAEAGHFCLALSHRVEHVRHLFECWQSNTKIPAAFATGSCKKADREAAIQKMRDGEAQVLFATKIADEGLDLPRLNRLFLTCPSRHHGKIIQQIGRITRPFPGKTDALVFDFLDEFLPMASAQYRARKTKVYNHYEVRELCPTSLETLS